jgi:hypothetical protein
MHTKTKATLAVLSIALGVGCSHRPEERRPPAREFRAEPRADWSKLGERWVDGAHDRDVIFVGARDRAYRRIMIVVEHSALEMDDLVVHFADGTAFAPQTRHVFAANTRSHVIDLPGSWRAIQSVEFRYGNLPGGGRAQAELWAQ